MHWRPLWCMHCRGGSACTAGVAVHALHGGQCMHCRGCGACTTGGAVHALQGGQYMHCRGGSACTAGVPVHPFYIAFLLNATK